MLKFIHEYYAAVGVLAIVVGSVILSAIGAHWFRQRPFWLDDTLNRSSHVKPPVPWPRSADEASIQRAVESMVSRGMVRKSDYAECVALLTEQLKHDEN